MEYPAALNLSTIEEYRHHYEEEYCQNPVITFDGIPVYFKKDRFSDAFFESSKRNGIKDQFSEIRAKRMDWIKAALQDPDADIRAGWDKIKKQYDFKRRVCIVVRKYVVVIGFSPDRSKAFFYTAYVANSLESLNNLRKAPKWK